MHSRQGPSCRATASHGSNRVPWQKKEGADMKSLSGRGFAAVLVLLMVLVLGLGAAQLWAQSDNAQISGFVKDPTGAVVPEAKVVVRSVGKGTERTARTNAQGYYVVSNLPPDLYNISVEKEGFKRTTIENKKLDAGIAATADANLQIGQTSQVVEVT